MDAILAKALEQGVGYGLFVLLLIWVMKKQDDRDNKSDIRETKYQEIISNLTETVQKDINCLGKDICDIKEKIFK